MGSIAREIENCQLCAQRFGATASGHAPRPVAWFKPGARILVAGQAPGMRVHETGRPFNDASGDRLRAWLGVEREAFYDQDLFAFVPMAFCFPGYDARGADLPPPKLCAQTWHAKVLQALGDVRLTVLVGGHAQAYHLPGRMSVTARVQGWRDHAPGLFPLPHPSWRNTAWLRKNPWFEADLLPQLRAQVREILDDPDPA
jgi:uracil-DNA glycosylase